MNEFFNDGRASCSDEQREPQVPEKENKNINLQRYTRPILYSLRNAAKSLQRPDCANRCELQTLSFWKCSSGSGSNHENISSSVGLGSGNSDVTSACSTAVISGGQFSANARGRDRQLGYARGMRSGDVSFSHANTTSQKASFIDQRSNSIAHLMPAFAKKRIAAAAAQNQSSSDQTSADYHEPRANEEVRNTNFEGPCRPVRGKEHSHEHQKRENNDNIHSYISPHRRNLNEHDRDSGGGGINTRHGNSMLERRIGSGRLLPRDVNWEYHDKNSSASQQRTSSRFSDRAGVSSGSNLSYHEKNSFDRRNSGTGNEKLVSNTSSSNRRYNLDEHIRSQRQTFKDRNDEPEWFSGGPTSQNDIIELRGFDEPVDDNENEQSCERTDTHKIVSGEDNIAELSQSSSSYDLNPEVQANIKPIENVSGGSTSVCDSSDVVELPDKIDENEQTQVKADMSKEFNFDAFFNLDSLESEIMHHGSDEQQKDITSGGSRFSRWFVNNNNSEQTSNEKSPDLSKNAPKAGNVLEFFQNAKINSTAAQKVEMPSVGELEAKMRKVDIQENPIDTNMSNKDNQFMVDSNDTQKSQPVVQDMEAFKKLLQQLNNGDVKKEVLDRERLPHCSSPNKFLGIFPFMGMQHSELSQTTSLIPVASGPPLSTNHDETARTYQLQQQRFPPISPSQPIERNPSINPNFMNDNLIDQQKRRDFVNLLHAVTRGQIPLAFLEKELNNPSIPISTKEIISAVIRETTRSIGETTPSLSILNSQAQLSPVNFIRGSPVNLQGIHSHASTNVIQPRDIHGPSNQIKHQQIHSTEQITPTGPTIGIGNLQDAHMRCHGMIQNVIIKKKPEEQQQEVTRRPNEFQKQQSDTSQVQAELLSPQHQMHSQNAVSGLVGYPNRHQNSPTPLAFTPTSVLRKMTADKDNGSPQMQQHSQLHKLLPHMQNKPLNHGVFLPQNQQQQLISAIPQPRMILGGNHTNSQMVTSQQPIHAQAINQSISPQTLPPLPQNFQQHRVIPNETKWQMNLIAQQGGMPLNKPMGRPILKGPTPSIAMPMPQQTQKSMQLLGHLQPTATQHPNPQAPAVLFPAKLDMPQLRHKSNQTPQHMPNSQPTPQGLSSGQHLQQPVPQNVLHMQQQQMFQLHHMSLQQQQHMQLQRQLHQQIHSQPSIHSQRHQHENTNRNANFTQPQQTAITNSTNNVNSTVTPSMCPREGGLSPTSNQLAQWFSPELLAQASAGKLPQININQALSLEEFERNIQQHSSTVVHN